MRSLYDQAVVSVVLAGLLGCGGSSTVSSRPASGDDVVLEGDSAARPERHSATATVARGEKHLVAGEVAPAQAAFEEALASNPRDARALLDLGLTFELRKDAARAESAYRRALAVDPGFPQALNNLGLLLREKGQTTDAVQQFERALKEDPSFAEAQTNLALALEDSGDDARALTAYRRAVELSPRDAMLRANFGQLLLKKGSTSEAQAQLRNALSLANGNVAALLAIGNGLRRAGAADLAVEAMRRAIAARDGGPTPALLAELSLAQRAQGDRGGAEASLSRALELDGRYALGHYLLAGLQASRGAYTDAIEHYRRYLALEPQGAHAERAKQSLAAAERAAQSSR